MQSGTVDWDQIFALAHAHGVAPLVYQNLQIVGATGVAIPDRIIHHFKLATYQNALAKQNQVKRLVQCLDYLHTRQIDVMIVKGLALDLLVYEQPWYTVTRDVDLVLRPRYAEGWQSGVMELASRFHGLGIEFEFDSHHDVTLNGALPIDFGQFWRDANEMEFEGYPVYLMAPEDMLLAICINSCRKRYFWLRSLCDIAETIKRFPDLDWRLFARRAIAYGCNNIVYTALTVADATVTSQIPRQALDNLAVGTLRRFTIHKAIQYLVRQVPLTSLSHYNGSKWIGRKIGWSLALPYLTYRWQQMGSKVHEAVTAYRTLRS